MRAKNVPELLHMKLSHEMRAKLGFLMYIYIYAKYIIKVKYV
jgi:hypothetical protein